MYKETFSPGVPQAWRDALERADADLAAGRVSDVATFLDELAAEDLAASGVDEGAADAARPAARF